MKPLLSVTLFLLLLPVQVFAKGPTSKITINGPGLKTPIEITDPNVVKQFNVWTGPGTWSSVPGSDPYAPGLIVDWAKAEKAPADGLARYEVSFYEKTPDERMTYVVFYEYDPATGHSYVYIPGPNDKFYSLNVTTIGHGVEGQWFSAWSAWDNVAKPLITEAKQRP
jgi:hypothetical protein